MTRFPSALLALFALAALFANAPAWAGDTLGDVLKQHSIPAGSPPLRNLDQRITSYEVRDTAAEFVIAYYVDDGSGRLQPPLYVARYSKADSRWADAAVSEKDATLAENSANCLGSADGIHRLGDFLLVNTQLSPSAGCVIVLNQNLAVAKLLDGWYLATLPPHVVVFHESMVHFAPTHPMKIAMYRLAQNQADSATASATILYPPADDPLRAQYIQRVRPLTGDEQWCDQHNSHCDAEQFENDLTSVGSSGKGLVEVNDAAHALAFVAEFSPVGIVPDEVIQAKPDLKVRVVYVYRLSASGFDYREFPLVEMEDRFGASSIEDLVNPPVLDKVFASGGR